MKKILLADDHGIVRSGIRSLILDNFSAVGVDEAGTEQEIVHCVKTSYYDLVVLDISIPNTDFGMLMNWIMTTSETTKLLIFSMYPEEVYGVRCLQLGASGYLRKTASNEEIVMAIRRILEGRKYISERMAELLSDSTVATNMNNPFENLSTRELEIAKHLNDGKSLPEICEILKIQYSTANTLKRRIFDKLNVDSVLSLSRLMKTFEMD